MKFDKLLKASFPFIKGILIFIIGHFAAVLIVKAMHKAFSKTKLDSSLCTFLEKLINMAIHIIVILSALNAVGISTTGLLAALSAAAVGIALALKDSLSNIAGGILLLLSPRFSTGDYIEINENGIMGQVLSVGLMSTIIKTYDNRQISLPNGMLMNSEIINHFCEETRRLTFVFPISYGDDFKLAEKLIKDTALSNPYVLSEHTPSADIINFGDSSIDIEAHIWCKSENYWKVYYGIRQQVLESFNNNGITVPFNQLDVHIDQSKNK